VGATATGMARASSCQQETFDANPSRGSEKVRYRGDRMGDHQDKSKRFVKILSAACTVRS
jgi:hypothetical protein